jgi:hypothetical protein
MRESLVNQEGDRLPENPKGHEENSKLVQTQGWEQRPSGMKTPNKLAFPAINCMCPG